ncbi:MAG TPA: hypothetical protein VIL36_05955 [Acidimicrobiales bacterium]
MGTQRASGSATERAGAIPPGHHPTIRWRRGTPLLLVLALALTGCASSLSGTGPEVIRYCAESVQGQLRDAASSCVRRP